MVIEKNHPKKKKPETTHFSDNIIEYLLFLIISNQHIPVVTTDFTTDFTTTLMLFRSLLLCIIIKFAISNHTIWLDDLEHNLASEASISICANILDLNQTSVQVLR